MHAVLRLVEKGIRENRRENHTSEKPETSGEPRSRAVARAVASPGQKLGMGLRIRRLGFDKVKSFGRAQISPLPCPSI